jgi:hypothetical protein
MTSAAYGPSNVRAQFNGFPVVLRGGKCLVIARFAFRAHAREVVPDAGRIGVLNDINDPKASPQWQKLEAAGRGLGVNVAAVEVHTPNDLIKKEPGRRCWRSDPTRLTGRL